MMKVHVRHVCIGLALIGFALLGGCGKKKYQAPPIDQNAMAGNWVELVKAPSGRSAPQTNQKQTAFRHLTINADKTFVFTLVDDSGKQIGTQKAEGTVAVNTEKHEITFTITNNGFQPNDKGANWAPATSSTLQEELVDGSTKMLIFSITDVGGTSARYKKAE